MKARWVDAPRPALVFDEKHEIHVNFKDPKSAYNRKLAGKQELLAKAVGFKGQSIKVLDPCFGLGVDAWTLVRLGMQVLAFERNPMLVQLFNRSLEFDQDRQELAQFIDHFELVQGEASDLMQNRALEFQPKVVYLDPMFPNTSKTALPKIELQLLRKWVEVPEEKETSLFELALNLKPDRIVVKRPRLGPVLIGKPDWTIEGKSHRFDVYSPLPR